MGTCRMGPRNDPIAVVSDELNVYGVDGLCIADSSVMLEMVSANIYSSDADDCGEGFRHDSRTSAASSGGTQQLIP